MPYIIEDHKLLIGDIILTKDDTKISKAIRLATDGDFSHAMIFVGGTLIHAMLDGVYSKNPQRLLF